MLRSLPLDTRWYRARMGLKSIAGFHIMCEKVPCSCSSSSSCHTLSRMPFSSSSRPSRLLATATHHPIPRLTLPHRASCHRPCLACPCLAFRCRALPCRLRHLAVVGRRVPRRLTPTAAVNCPGRGACRLSLMRAMLPAVDASRRAPLGTAVRIGGRPPELLDSEALRVPLPCTPRISLPPRPLITGARLVFDG